MEKSFQLGQLKYHKSTSASGLYNLAPIPKSPFLLIHQNHFKVKSCKPCDITKSPGITYLILVFTASTVVLNLNQTQNIQSYVLDQCPTGVWYAAILTCL
jgi:hypothetical protein